MDLMLSEQFQFVGVPVWLISVLLFTSVWSLCGADAPRMFFPVGFPMLFLPMLLSSYVCTLCGTDALRMISSCRCSCVVYLYALV